MEKVDSFFDDDFLFQEPERTDDDGFFLCDFLLNMGSRHGWFCWCCKKPMPDWEPQMCCNGRECGCYGKPIEPPLCSKKCWELGMGGYNRRFKHMWE